MRKENINVQSVLKEDSSKQKNGLSNHMKLHFEPEHECNQCGKKFHQSHNLNRHMKIHLDPTYLCIKCGKKFHDATNFKKHEKTHLR